MILLGTFKKGTLTPDSEFVLIDTSVWIAYFGAERSSVEPSVEMLLAAGRAATTSAVRFEFLPHVKDGMVHRRCQAFFDLLRLLREKDGFWERCETMQRRLIPRVRGIGFIDLLLADVAVTHGASVYSLDKHFPLMAEVISLPLYHAGA